MPPREAVAARALPEWYPARYRDPWLEPFERRCLEGLAPGARILDVGGGARPSLARADRPPGSVYVALDTSAEQIRKAGPGAYDEVHLASATERLPQLVGQFDLVVSWQALEHVRPLDRVLENVHAYLRPGGRFVALVSGTFAAFAVAGRLVPHSVATRAMSRLLGRQPETVFPAHYDHCWHGALTTLLRPWARAEVVPLFRGGGYFSFSPPLARAYLAYESWAERGAHANLATHYLIDATA